MRHQSLRSRFTTSLMGLTIFGALSALAIVPAHAIPTAGEYTFTSGLTGQFTILGTTVTEFDILDPFHTANHLLSTDPQLTIVTNNDHTFEIQLPDRFLNTLTLNWDKLSFSRIELEANGSGNFAILNGAFSFQSSTQQVPEPSSAVLTGVGLVLLLGYGWRQRRQAGLHVG